MLAMIMNCDLVFIIDFQMLLNNLKNICCLHVKASDKAVHQRHETSEVMRNYSGFTCRNLVHQIELPHV